MGFDGGTLTPRGFEAQWPHIARVLDSHPEMWEDYHTKESLYNDVMSGALQAWAFSEDEKIRVILFTRLIDYPAGRILQVMLGFGNSIDRLLPQIEATLENFGRTTGCKLCEVIGRDGWAKKLSHRFKKRAVVLLAPISEAAVN